MNWEAETNGIIDKGTEGTYTGYVLGTQKDEREVGTAGRIGAH